MTVPDPAIAAERLKEFRERLGMRLAEDAVGLYEMFTVDPYRPTMKTMA